MTSSKLLDHLFEAFAHPKRRAMIDTLGYRPATISQLASEQQLSLPAIHKHIKVLERANLIQRRKVGRTNFVALTPSSLGIAQQWIMQFHTGWYGDKQTLENYIASLESRT